MIIIHQFHKRKYQLSLLTQQFCLNFELKFVLILDLDFFLGLLNYSDSDLYFMTCFPFFKFNTKLKNNYPFTENGLKHKKIKTFGSN
ncbi:hypothetical protein BpHYR1_017014 [Brachionus plicatilis]|uniref:Uncharacterized protein n=1 Tax=Brachionus plicatilis TaxID=10195 RepID=A0A3M7PXZ0_BRAPC|nr:hypothetical protein BpHYR1_017014 [Brachionus plicatilis]